MARFGILPLSIVVALPVGAAGTTQAADAARPAVIELYTSQGCDSCPPADALLGRLAQREGVLALSFHVDYWDQYGWRDIFELPVAKQRQLAYVRHFANDWVYTPQLIIDGASDVIGMDSAVINRLLAAPRSGVPVRITVDGGELQVSVDAAAGRPAAEVALLAYRPEAETAIGRGENAGRTLREYNIVRSCTTLGSWRGAAATWRVPLDSLPADASRAAVLVQEPGPGPIIGAAQAMLPR